LDDLQEMADYMCRLMVETMNIKACAIYLLNIEETELQILADYGLSRAYLLKGPVDPKKSLGSALQGQALIISDIEQDMRLQYPEHARKEQIKAIAEVPIRAPEKIIGSFRMYNSTTWDISEHDLDSLYSLGELMGLAISYSSLANALQNVREIVKNLPIR
jgi:signal transduction protein with GAF and PtsI domain